MRRVTEPLFGVNPVRTDLLLILLTAGIGAAAVLMQAETRSTLEQIVLLILTLDVLGGVVANMTRATNDWYTSHPPILSYLFLVVHALQPLLVVLILGAEWSFFAFLYGYSLLAGSWIIHQRTVPSHRVQAAALMTIGMILYSAQIRPPPDLIWFGYAYLFKLVYAFAVDHSPG